MKLLESNFVRNLFVAFLVSLVTLSLVVLFSSTSMYSRLEDTVYDNFFRTVKVDKNKTNGVAIVAIDDMSLIEGDSRELFWPWPRDMYAIISKFLVDHGAKAVVFDIIFSGPDMDRADSYGAENDNKFYDAIIETGKVVLPFNIDNRFAKNDKLNPRNINDLKQVQNIKEFRYLYAPYSLFTENNTNFGFVDIDSESDGVIRNYRPLVKIKNNYYPSLSLVTYLLSNGDNYPKKLDLDKNGNFKLKWYGRGGTLFTRIPLRRVSSEKFENDILTKVENESEKKILIDSYIKDVKKDLYILKRGMGIETINRLKDIYSSIGVVEEIDNERSTLNYYSAWYVFFNALRYSRGRDYSIPKDTFKDKVVFIGSSARGLLDQKNTPFTTKGNAYPGVEIHATAYLNMVNKDWLKDNPIVLELLIFFIASFILAFFGINAKSLAKYSIIFTLVIVLAGVISYLLFIKFNISSKIVLFTLQLLTLYLFALIVNYIFVGHNRNVIKNVFGTYLSPELVKKISDANRPIAADGENINASAFFVDIQGFTTFSEKNSPEIVVEVLNLYLKAFSEIIMNNKGFVNKFLGDGLMALFGAPDNFKEHADMALKSAIECYKINNELTKDYGLNVRIGVNSGKMIVGNMGGGKRLEYTAIGDNVNMASRFEGANKFFETKIIIGENTYDQLTNKDKMNYLGKFSVKGKDIPVGLYYYANCDERDSELFTRLVKAYESKDKVGFEEYLNQFSKQNPNFGPYSFYANYYKDYKDKFGEPVKFNEK